MRLAGKRRRLRGKKLLDEALHAVDLLTGRGLVLGGDFGDPRGDGREKAFSPEIFYAGFFERLCVRGTADVFSGVPLKLFQRLDQGLDR